MKILIATLSVAALACCTSEAQDRPFCVWVTEGPNEVLVSCHETISECRETAKREGGSCQV